MGLDIRLPVGLLFVLLGAILSVYGLAGDPARYQQSLGIDINLYWGVILFIFGIAMFLLGRRGTKAQKAAKALQASELRETAPRSSPPSHR